MRTKSFLALLALILLCSSFTAVSAAERTNFITEVYDPAGDYVSAELVVVYFEFEVDKKRARKIASLFLQVNGDRDVKFRHLEVLSDRSVLLIMDSQLDREIATNAQLQRIEFDHKSYRSMDEMSIKTKSENPVDPMENADTRRLIRKMHRIAYSGARMGNAEKGTTGDDYIYYDVSRVASEPQPQQKD